jgi:integrase
MPKTNIPNYRLHKATGQAFVELGGHRFYLGKYGSKASREEYERRIAEYLANNRKLPPTQTKKAISCQELAIIFLEWAEGYYVKNNKITPTFAHCRNAVSMLVKFYGNESVNQFSPQSLLYLQEKWVSQGLARPTVNRYVTIIKQVFKHGCKYGWVDQAIYGALLCVDNLKKGRTKAHEYRDIKPVPDDVVNRTLPFMPPIVADMVRVQLLCGMRPQEVRNLRSVDIIDRDKDVWRYVPFTHKTEHKGKNRAIAIGTRTQAILTSYLAEKADEPDSFLFSPKDTVKIQKIEKRRNRKTFNKQGNVQPSQQDRSKPESKKCGVQYSKDSYTRAIERACKKAGVPHWTPNQLRHSAGTKIRKEYDLDTAQAFLGHTNADTTQIYAELSFEKAAKVAREIG